MWTLDFRADVTSYMFLDYNQTYQDPAYSEWGRLHRRMEGVVTAYISLFQFYCKPNIDLKSTI